MHLRCWCRSAARLLLKVAFRLERSKRCPAHPPIERDKRQAPAHVSRHSARFLDSTLEEDRATGIIDDREQERMVDMEDFLRLGRMIHGGKIHRDSGAGCSFGAVLRYIDDGAVHDRADGERRLRRR